MLRCHRYVSLLYELFSELVRVPLLRLLGSDRPVSPPRALRTNIVNEESWVPRYASVCDLAILPVHFKLWLVNIDMCDCPL